MQGLVECRESRTLHVFLGEVWSRQPAASNWARIMTVPGDKQARVVSLPHGAPSPLTSPQDMHGREETEYESYRHIALCV